MEKNNTINGRTPEEIKKGLECCMNIECTPDCPYFGNEAVDCNIALNTDAAVAISQLIRERDEARNDLDTLNYANTELHSAYEAMKRERDAAVEDMKAATLCGCHVCKHYYRPNPESCKYACRIHGSFEEHDFIADDGSMFCGAFEWRGVQEVE